MCFNPYIDDTNLIKNMKLVKQVNFKLVFVKTTEEDKFIEYCFLTDLEEDPVFIFTKEDLKQLVENLS
jgi:hypothetical protein